MTEICQTGQTGQTGRTGQTGQTARLLLPFFILKIVV